MELDIQATNVFERNYQAVDDGYRLIVNQGGTRSSKTYSILQLIIVKCLEESGKTYSIVRKTFPSLRTSVYRDFIEILKEYNIYDEADHNKTEAIYYLNDNIVEFFALDNEQKIRGTRRHVLYCNEANELNYPEYQQLNMRTEDYILLDYNPSDPNHFVYTKVLGREDCILIKSTFLDNPYLPETLINELLILKETDEDWWRIYGLGERGTGKENIFQFTEYTSLPESAEPLGIGLDFGFTNDPTGIVRGYKNGTDLYLEELVYQTHLTNQDIFNKLKYITSKNEVIYADSAEPKSIEELRRMGLNIRATKKGKDSILAGIDILKRFKIHIKGENIKTEFLNYKWSKDKNGDLTNNPLDKWNHIIDAARYLVFMTQSRPNYGQYCII
jgi:phage terminase large subunit